MMLNKLIQNKNLLSIIPVVLFLIAFAVRLLFIFKITSPDSEPSLYEDAYYRWKIAYVSRDTMFNNGFLELADTTKMQYFWGLLHPILSVLAFNITGSTGFFVLREMTSLLGSMSIVIIYLLCRRYWNLKTALITASFIALSPIAIFNDSSAMAEPIGIFFLLLGIYFWSRKPFLSGINFALSIMARVENWPLSVFIIFSILLFSKTDAAFKKLYLLLGYLLPVILYFFYLYYHTGNPIYPFYMNYITNISGGSTIYVTKPPVWIKYIFICITLASMFWICKIIFKKGESKFVYLLGLGNLFLLGVTFGISNFTSAFFPHILLQRRFVLAFDFLVMITAVLLFSKKYTKKAAVYLESHKMNTLIIIFLFTVMQLLWKPILSDYHTNGEIWNGFAENTKLISKRYHGGGLVVTYNSFASVYYLLVKEANIPSSQIVLDTSDPYFTMSTDPLQNWVEYKKMAVSWIKQNNIKMIVTYPEYSYRFTRLMNEEPAYFANSIVDKNLIIYELK